MGETPLESGPVPAPPKVQVHRRWTKLSGARVACTDRGGGQLAGMPTPRSGGATDDPGPDPPRRPRGRHPVRRPAHRAAAGRAGHACWTSSASARSRSWSSGRCPTRSASERRDLELPPPASESAGARRAACARRQEPAADLDDRPRLLRHGHPAGDPPQRPREPGLVHRLHALPAGDLPGPARGAAELPDDGRRPHRPAARQRLHARRVHRGRRGHDARAPGRARPSRPASSSTPTRSRRPSP